MDLIRIGRAHRAIRIHLGRRQADVAASAGVSQQLVSDFECGRGGKMTLEGVDRLFRALGARAVVSVAWQGGDLDRLLDEGHAAIEGFLSGRLRADGWEVLAEVTFSVYGERGSIDLLAWHPATRTLLVVEVKTEITSAEEMLRRHDAKVRLAAGICRERFGVAPAAVARLLALADTSRNRRHIARLASLLDGAYPTRGAALREWLARPSGAIGGLLFADTAGAGVGRGAVRPRRVRRALTTARGGV
jgi:transcriptional regulator with XRE-family HTH domain